MGCGWAFQSAAWLVQETAQALDGGADLDAADVHRATLVSAGGRWLRVDTSYDAAARTVTVTLPAGAGGPVQLSVSTALSDIDGHHLGAPFQTGVGVVTASGEARLAPTAATPPPG